jgi:choloylglycine hydrolase
MKTLSLISFSFVSFCQLLACTGILIQAKDQTAINGRTVEFGMPLDMSLAVIPRNISFIGKTPSGSGLQYRSKYAAVGIYCFDDPVLMDGVNEKGLVAAAFYFPGYASYAKVNQSNRSKALSPADFPNWLLTQFASLEEVKQALHSVVIAPTVLKDWGSEPPPMHYIVYDKTGKSIVIEPVEGTLKVYENPVGVITNSPTFDWQMTNLHNYINLTPYNSKEWNLRSYKITPFGQGTGMIGLPGDFSPPSRFVRAAFFSAAALRSKNADEAVDQAFHILNQFDIPLGSIRQKERGQTSYDYTLLTSVKNPKTSEYFYRSYSDQSIQFVSLHQFDLNAKRIKTMKIQGDQEKFDVSSMLR